MRNLLLIGSRSVVLSRGFGCVPNCPTACVCPHFRPLRPLTSILEAPLLADALQMSDNLDLLPFWPRLYRLVIQSLLDLLPLSLLLRVLF